jgi:hypothetical protein
MTTTALLLLIAAATTAADRVCGTYFYFANLTWGTPATPFLFDLDAMTIRPLDISIPEAPQPSWVPCAVQESYYVVDDSGGSVYSFVTDENIGCSRNRVVHLYSVITNTISTYCDPNTPAAPMRPMGYQMFTSVSAIYSQPGVYTTWSMTYNYGTRRSVRISARSNKNDAASAFDDTYAYYIGGGGAGLVSYDGGAHLNWDCPTDTFERCDYYNGGTCTTLAPAPAPIGNGVTVLHDNVLHVIGGNLSCALEASPHVYSYDLLNGTWVAAIPDMPDGRVGHSATVHEDILYVAGGYVTWERTPASGPPAAAVTYPACELIAYNFSAGTWSNVLCGGLRLSLLTIAPFCTVT